MKEPSRAKQERMDATRRVPQGTVVRRSKPRKRPQPVSGHGKTARSSGSRLDDYLQKAKKRNQGTEGPSKIPAWEKERLHGAKLYRLTAYTTRDKITRKFKAEARQAFLQRLVATALILLFLLLLFNELIPLKTRSELDRISGGDSQVDEWATPEQSSVPLKP